MLKPKQSKPEPAWKVFKPGALIEFGGYQFKVTRFENNKLIMKFLGTKKLQGIG